MLRRLPPLNGLKAFEAAARSESFTRAAEELCVTQGAVSHQVKAWPAPGSEDTEFGVLMGPEVRHGASEVYAGVQA